MKAKSMIYQILKAMNNSCLQSNRSLLKTNKIQGALIYPEFNLLLQYGAANVHLSCDHLAIVDSPCSGTPAIRDVVINAVNAKSGELYFESNGIFIQWIEWTPELILLTVSSPEVESKGHDVTVDMFLVNWVRKVISTIKLPVDTSSPFSRVEGVRPCLCHKVTCLKKTFLSMCSMP